jgi:hypothetical protein
LFPFERKQVPQSLVHSPAGSRIYVLSAFVNTL